MKKITFYSPHLGLRGTEVTMFDYAFYGRKLYNWDVQILYHEENPNSHISAIQKFQKEFDVHSITDPTDNPLSLNGAIETFLESHPSEYFYIQKGGHNDGLCLSNSKTCILCCTMVDPKKEKHGDRYAFISDWLSQHCSKGEIPVVPSIVDLPDIQENLREELSIPKDAIVFGRTGGMDTWNLPFTNTVVEQICQHTDDIYFVFQNTPRFIDHPQVIFIPPTSDLTYKVQFINTCDALLHSRHEGESFGVTCGEFSIRNKPVITFFHSFERNHINLLGDKGIYYENGEQLFRILHSFRDNHLDKEKDWNCYRQFQPEKVMPQFKKVFID